MAQDGGGFEQMLRMLAREMSQAAADKVGELDPEELARSLGVDPDSIRHWAEEAGRWIRTYGEQAGDFSDLFRPGSGPPGRYDEHTVSGDPSDPRESAPAPGSRAEDPLRRAAPSPLDLPSAEQGTALAALDSQRWAVEPGTEALAVRGDGPGPSDALGLVRELRARDWIAADGELTLAGRAALTRWLEASA